VVAGDCACCCLCMVCVWVSKYAKHARVCRLCAEEMGLRPKRNRQRVLDGYQYRGSSAMQCMVCNRTLLPSSREEAIVDVTLHSIRPADLEVDPDV
jgi:hypothetical protein